MYRTDLGLRITHRNNITIFTRPSLQTLTIFYCCLQIDVTSAMLDRQVNITLNETTRIPFKIGDVFGMYFPDNAIVKFSK